MRVKDVTDYLRAVPAPCRRARLAACRAIVLLALLPGVAPAQDVPGSRDTLLARLTGEALMANPGARRADALARSAEARIRPAGALPDPMASAGVMDFVLPSFAFRESDFTEVDLEARQELPWPGTLRARTDAARATAVSKRSEAAATRREVVVAVARTYFRLRYVVSARATLARQRALFGSAVEIATARYASGSAPQADPLQARLARARLDVDETWLVAEEASLRAELGALRDRSGRDSLTVTPIEPMLDHLTSLHERVATLETSTTADHPSLSARRQGIEAARAAARVESFGVKPDFTLTLRYGARPIASDFFSAFVGLRVPIWAGRKQHRLADAAREETRAAEAELATAERALEAERSTLQAGIAAAWRRIEILASQVIPAARETTEAALRSYRVGQVDFLNLLATQDSQYRTEVELAMAIADHLTHLVMLEELVRPGEEQ